MLYKPSLFPVLKNVNAFCPPLFLYLTETTWPPWRQCHDSVTCTAQNASEWTLAIVKRHLASLLAMTDLLENYDKS